MEFSKYLDFLDIPSHFNYMCSYCGSVLYNGRLTEDMCQMCEAYVMPTKEATANNPVLNEFTEIQMLINKQRQEEAIVRLGRVTIKPTDINYLYGCANIYGLLSDIAYNDLDYNSHGFMEANSANIYSSLDLTAKSKEMFYKALNAINSNQTVARTPEMQYLKFMIYIKLGLLADAEKTLSNMGITHMPLLRGYADMVYNVKLNTRKADAMTQFLIQKGSVNSAYYLGKRYIGRKQYKKAYQVLSRLIGKVRMPMAIFALYKLDRFMDETRL